MECRCSITGEPFVVCEREAEFCRKHETPMPQLNYFERLRRMLSFRNSLHLSKAACAHSGASIISAIPAESGLKVLDVEYWSGSEWDACAYGRPYDFRRPFFEQFAELMRAAPFPSLGVIRSTMENSDYTNDITGAKNCCLMFGATNNEDCLFCQWLWDNRALVDCVYAFDCEGCYDCVDIRKCYNLSYSAHCSGCADGGFLDSCRSCRDCYGCVNLSRKQYCFYNEQLTEGEYRRRLAELDAGSFHAVEQARRRFAEFRSQFPLPAQYAVSAENSWGNHLANTQNCEGAFFVSDSQDVSYAIGVVKARDVLLQASYGDEAELIYCSTGVGDHAYNLKCCWECWQNVRDLEYCVYVTHGCSSCFGCVGLKGKSYCILNRQYDRGTYEDLVRRIKQQMRQSGDYGAFFPPELSPHAYNLSWAAQFMPLSREQALARGFAWSNAVEPDPGVCAEVPDHIKDVGDDVLSKTFRCISTGKPFRFTREELKFYRARQAPLPRIAPLERIKAKHGFFLVQAPQEVLCSRCGAGTYQVRETGTQPVVCRGCYEGEVLG